MAEWRGNGNENDDDVFVCGIIGVVRAPPVIKTNCEQMYSSVARVAERRRPQKDRKVIEHD